MSEKNTLQFYKLDNKGEFFLLDNGFRNFSV